MAGILAGLLKLLGQGGSTAAPNYAQPITGADLPQVQSGSGSLDDDLAALGIAPSSAAPIGSGAGRGASAQLPQVGASTAPDASANPAPQATANPPIQPQIKKHSPLVNWADSALFRNAISETDKQDLANQMGQYQRQINQAFAAKLPDDGSREAFIRDPAGFATAYNKRFEPQTVKAGDTERVSGQPDFTATQFDDKSGAFVQPGAGGGLNVTPSAGGDMKAEGGIIYSQRTGQPGARYALPQKLAPGEHIGTVTPGVTAPGAPTYAQLPQAAPGAPQDDLGPVVVPSPASIAGLVPGARVTSGFRLPQKNAAVGGVANSWHTAGTPDAPGALDIVPPQGMGMPALAATLAKQLPQTRILNEGDHVHIQPNQRNTGAVAAPAAGGQTADATGSIVDNGPASAPLWSAPAWNQQTNSYQQTNNATGEVRDAGKGTFDVQSAKQNFTGSEQYKNYTSSQDAFGAMLHAVSLPNGGIRAYALRDTFARLINPGAVARVGTIEALKQSQGVPANVKSYFMNLKGDGDVPPEIAQQILDVSRGFLGSHYQSAKTVNDANAAQAARNGQNPQDATVPMETLPGNVHLMLPPKTSLVSGDVYRTGRGLAQWNGQGFVPYGR